MPKKKTQEEFLDNLREVHDETITMEGTSELILLGIIMIRKMTDETIKSKST